MKQHLIQRMMLLLAGLTAAAVFYVTPYTASNLEISPDSGEYAIGAYHIVTGGNYCIKISGESLPSRYPPWFSMLILAPAYLIFGNEIGNAIYPVLLFAISGVLVAFLIGRRISGNWGGMFAAMSLIALPLYREHARLIMTDVPSSAMAIMAACLYIRMRTTNQASLAIIAFAGGIGALSAAIRPVSLSILIPFLLTCLSTRHGEKRITKLLLLALPSAMYISANMAYNNSVFGSPLRNGYNFWCPVPFDYPSLCFSPGYMILNIKAILLSPIPALAISGVVFYLLNIRFGAEKHEQESDMPLRYLVEFTVAASVPLVAVHLFYFYQAERFYLPVIALMAVICASMAGKWMKKLPSPVAPAVQALLATVIIISSVSAPRQIPFNRILAEQLDSRAPANAIIISSVDPVYLDFFVGKSTSRLILPLSRNVEYASKVVCPVKVHNPEPFPSSWSDHRCAGLLKGGARDIIPATAGEEMNFLRTEAGHGRPIFMETCLVATRDAKIVEMLQTDFDFIKRDNFIYQLVLKKTR